MQLPQRGGARAQGWGSAVQGLEAGGMPQQISLGKGHSPCKLLDLLAAADSIYLRHTRHFALFRFPAQKRLEPRLREPFQL